MSCPKEQVLSPGHHFRGRLLQRRDPEKVFTCKSQHPGRFMSEALAFPLPSPAPPSLWRFCLHVGEALGKEPTQANQTKLDTCSNCLTWRVFSGRWRDRGDQNVWVVVSSYVPQKLESSLRFVLSVHPQDCPREGTRKEWSSMLEGGGGTGGNDDRWWEEAKQCRDPTVKRRRNTLIGVISGQQDGQLTVSNQGKPSFGLAYCLPCPQSLTHAQFSDAMAHRGPPPPPHARKAQSDRDVMLALHVVIQLILQGKIWLRGQLLCNRNGITCAHIQCITMNTNCAHKLKGKPLPHLQPLSGVPNRETQTNKRHKFAG